MNQNTGSDRLKNRDYELIIDASMSMNTIDTNGRSRWQNVEETARGIAHRVSQYDPDGIGVSIFSSRNKRYDNVGPETVDKIFSEREPMGSTALHVALQDAFSEWKKRKKAGQLKEGTTLVVITDGEPDDENAVARAIVDVTRHVDDRKELAISFLQIGNDANARNFLKRLDDDLQREGAKHDIVDAKSFTEMEDMSLTEVLIAAMED